MSPHPWMKARVDAARPHSQESGVALLAAMFVAFGIVFVGTAFLTVGDYEVDLVAKEKEATQAFWLAEAGRHHGMMVLTRDYAYIAPTSSVPSLVSQSTTYGSYVTSLAVAGTVLTLTSTGTTPAGTTRSVRTLVNVESFAKYAYYTEAEYEPGGTPIWFYTGDRIEGPTHTNGQIRIAGTPRFDDIVSSHHGTFRYYNNGDPYDSDQDSSPVDRPDFRGTPAPGYQLGAEEIPMPLSTGNLRQAAQSGGIALTGDYEVYLSRGTKYGTLSYRRVSPPGSWVRVNNPGNGVLHVNGNVQLQGKLDGALTIGCTGNVTILDNVVYRASSTSGIPTGNCDDYLGVVADRNIIVADNTANRSDLRLNGVFMALETSFEVQNYDSGDFRGTLTVWGGLLQKYRGPVGTFERHGSQTGYSKDYHFDTRMRTRTPPKFPISYRRTSWAPA